MYNKVIEKLKAVYDPEIPVDIYNLGLIYNIDIKGTEVFITMTLTTASCPAAAYLPEEIMNEVRSIEGITQVHVHVVYEPKWTSEMMSEEARFELGFA
jgi:FeS assembly SUF system protein